MSTKQLVLPIQADETKALDNYFAGPNLHTLQHLKAQLAVLLQPGQKPEQFTYLWGAAATGKSHLLIACCAYAHTQQLTAKYIDLSHAQSLDDVRKALGPSVLLCLDELDVLTDNLDQQKAVLSLFEAVRNQGGLCFIAGRNAPAKLSIELPDLLSRIKSVASYELHELDDAQKQLALQQAAQRKGFKLSDETAKWLLVHKSRDLAYLFDLLERIDAESLAKKRLVTIALIKSIDP